MITSVCVGVRKRPWAALCLGTCLSTFLGMVVCVTAETASAADCPGHPDALGTSRTLVVDPREHPRIGTMQYAQTLPLEDHEVVLTFDDGPLPKYSNQILQILADQCVKATFFTIGSQANANPEGVRKVRDAGHTVATHTHRNTRISRRYSHSTSSTAAVASARYYRVSASAARHLAAYRRHGNRRTVRSGGCRRRCGLVRTFPQIWHCRCPNSYCYISSQHPYSCPHYSHYSHYSYYCCFFSFAYAHFSSCTVPGNDSHHLSWSFQLRLWCSVGNP